jgi:hypothetical protein
MDGPQEKKDVKIIPPGNENGTYLPTLLHTAGCTNINLGKEKDGWVHTMHGMQNDISLPPSHAHLPRLLIATSFFQQVWEGKLQLSGTC